MSETPGRALARRLLAAALMASVCCADGYVIQLSQFEIHSIDPARYETDAYTRVDFSATLSYYAPAGDDPTVEPVDGDSVTILLVVLSLSGGQTVGNSTVGLPAGRLGPGRGVTVESTARVRVGRSACNASAGPELCAGVHSAYLSRETMDCLPVGTALEDGGAGEVNCVSPTEGGAGVQPYVIAIPVVMCIFLVVIVLFLCCILKKRRREGDLTDGEERLDFLSNPRKSLAHIYEDLARRVHVQFRRSETPRDAETGRLSVSNGTTNHAVQQEIWTDSQSESRRSVAEESDETADSSPAPSRVSISFAKRPSQPNQYTVVDPSLIRQLSPPKGEPLRVNVFVEGVPAGETADDDAVLDGGPGYAGTGTRLAGPESRRQAAAVEASDSRASGSVAIDADPDEGDYAKTIGGGARGASARAAQLAPHKTGDGENMLGPASPRDRAPSLNMPLREAPGAPSQLSDSEASSPDPEDEEEEEEDADDPPDVPLRAAPATLDPDPEPEPDYLPSKSARRLQRRRRRQVSTSRGDSYPGPGTDPDRASQPFAGEEKPELPPRYGSKPPTLDPGLGSVRDPESDYETATRGSESRRGGSDRSGPDPQRRSREKPEPSPRRGSKPYADGALSTGSTPNPDPVCQTRDSRRESGPDPGAVGDSRSEERPRPQSQPDAGPEPSVVRHPSPGPRAKPRRLAAGPVSSPDPVPTDRSPDEQAAGDTSGSPRSPESKPVPTVKPRKLSAKTSDEIQKPKLAPRPELPSKPAKRMSKSDPGIPADVHSIEDWSSRSCSGESRSAAKNRALSLTVYKPSQDNISHFPAVTPVLKKPPPPKTSVDSEIMGKAIDTVKQRASTTKKPSLTQFDFEDDPPSPDSNSPMSPSDHDFMQAVMETYLSLMFETSNGDEDYEVAIKREQHRVEVRDGPTPEPRTLMRRKSYSAQLTLRRKRKTIQSGGVYVNQWNKHWEFDRTKLSVDRKKPLGEGQFGKVYRAMAKGVKGQTGLTMVAVKELKGGAETDEKNEFLKEIAIHTIMKSHPHVVELLGCCIRDEPICIITEYLSGGDLLGFLRNKPYKQTETSMIWHYLAKFGLHIARGMAHVSQMEIVHRDLAARNILISDEEVCKVSDFGFARDIFGVGSYPLAPDQAPIRWYAPESIVDNLFSTKSDVWSFGILLYEIATLGKVKPYTGCSNDEVRLKVSAGMHPRKPPNCDSELFNIMLKCWQMDPDNRPTFSELVDIFEGIQELYPNPASDEELFFNEEDEEETF